MANKGTTSEVISQALSLNEYFVNEVLVAVTALKTDNTFVTSRNFPTLTNRNSKEYSGPTTSFKDEIIEVKKLFKIFTESTLRAESLRETAKVFLHAPLTHNYVIFDSFQKLKKTINAMCMIEKNRWYVTVDLPKKGFKKLI